MLDTPVSRNVKSIEIVKYLANGGAPQHLFQAAKTQRALQSQAQDRVLRSSDASWTGIQNPSLVALEGQGLENLGHSRKGQIRTQPVPIPEPKPEIQRVDLIV